METTRKCPYCGEEIMADAQKCRHCGEWLNDEAETNQELVREKDKKDMEYRPKAEAIVTTKPMKDYLADNNPRKSLFKSCFWEQITKHYCDFKGKIDRKTFWICYLYYSLIMLVVAGITAIAPLLGTILMTVVSLGLFLPFLGLMVRRLHDVGKKGTWILISLVPIVGAIWLLVLLAKKGETQILNKWSGKDTIITIAMVVVGFGLFAVGLFASGSDSSVDWESWFEEKQDSETSEIERQVLNSYRLHDIYNYETPAFKSVRTAADAYEESSGYLCVDWDYYYGTNEDVDLVKVSNVRAQIVENNKAHVFVTLEYEWSSEPTVLILVMVRDDKKGKWLVDDVRTTGEFAGSIKQLMIDCANSDWEEMSGENEDGSQFVVIDGSQLRLRLGPSKDSETFKGPDGTNSHPDVGEVFKYLGESGDFYKIDYNGNEVWVSKQYTHLEQ